MIEPPNANERMREQPVGPLDAEREASQAGREARSATIATASDECLRMARTGTLVAWGLVALGLVAGLERIVPLALEGGSGKGASGRAWAGVVFSILAYGLAGLATAAIARMTAAAVRECLERLAAVSDELLSQAARAVENLDRIVQVLAQGRGAESQTDPAGLDRASRLDEIRRLIRAADWGEAQSALTAFAADFPDDPRQDALGTELRQAKHHASQQQLAKLEAAREVNDPDGVLESYQVLVEALDDDARAALDRDLGKWFLALIHHRLRTSKIQPDMVQLASRFAEAFASTVEGASVRAALPTLRRSVGLCPRCGAPYTGVGDACPRCQPVTSAIGHD